MSIMIRALILLGAFTLTACTTSPTQSTLPIADDAAVRQLDSGAIRGFINAAGGHSWLGIPYAAPPVGERRWRAPLAPEGWTQQRDALRAPEV